MKHLNTFRTVTGESRRAKALELSSLNSISEQNLNPSLLLGRKMWPDVNVKPSVKHMQATWTQIKRFANKSKGLNPLLKAIKMIFLCTITMSFS